MNELNNDIRELNIDELDRVSGGNRSQGRQPFPLQPWASRLPRSPRWGWLVQGGIKAQTGDHRDGAAPGTTGSQKVQRGIAAVGDGDDGPLRSPAPHDEEELPCPVGDRLVPTSVLGVVAFGRSQGRHDG